MAKNGVMVWHGDRFVALAMISLKVYINLL